MFGRDKVAWFLANLCLRIATPRYRQFIRGAILYGMSAAAKDSKSKEAILDALAKDD